MAAPYLCTLVGICELLLFRQSLVDCMSALELNTGLFWRGHGALSEPRMADYIDEARPVDWVGLEEAGHEFLKSFREVESRICFLMSLPE